MLFPGVYDTVGVNVRLILIYRTCIIFLYFMLISLRIFIFSDIDVLVDTVLVWHCKGAEWRVSGE